MNNSCSLYMMCNKECMLFPQVRELECRIPYDAAKPLAGQQRFVYKIALSPGDKTILYGRGISVLSMRIAVLLLRGYILKGPWLISDVQRLL